MLTEKQLRSHMQMIEMIHKFNNQVTRFILVGGLNTLFGYMLFAAFITIGFNYVYAMLFTMCIGVLFSFKTTGKWVFKNSDKTLLLKFVLLYGVLYLVSIFLLRRLNNVFDNMYLIGFFTVMVTSVLSFLGSKYLIFSLRISGSS